MIGERLKELREDLYLNQEDVANQIKVSRSAYASWEIERSEPNISALRDLANFYNVSIDYLCCNTDIKSSYYKDKKLGQYINACLKIYDQFFKD